MAEKTVKVTLVRSLIGTKESHRATVRGLGLRRQRLGVTGQRLRLTAVVGMVLAEEVVVQGRRGTQGRRFRPRFAGRPRIA